MSSTEGRPTLFTNRELSWLDFNARVLARARRSDVPLLERLKFIAICASNLDEFYMVRVGTLIGAASGRLPMQELGGDGRRPAEVLKEIGQRAKVMIHEAARIVSAEIFPQLAQRGVRLLSRTDVDEAQREKLSAFYRREVHPCLTPIAIDPAHPFPQLKNKSLNLALRVEAKPKVRAGVTIDQPEGTLFALVQVPSVLPRFVPVDAPGAAYAFMALEDVIALHASELFPGHRIIESCPFRVTRASDLEIVEEEAENLLTSIQDGLRRRDRREAVRLQIVAGASDELTDGLREMLGLDDVHVHTSPGMIAMADLMAIYNQVDLPELKDEPFTPVPSTALRFTRSIFSKLVEGDVLLHHPYESFGHVVDFVESAADDPNVVAIKLTLYRTSGDSPIVRALARAAERGKQVTAIVELKARFDEAANIAWSRALEESGVHVVYGLIGVKVHCKLLLVIRREGNDLKRYLHLSTGNYNPITAKFYTDLSLLTAREDLTHDAMLLFNVLTGYGDLPPMQRLIVSPFSMRQHLVESIAREIEHAKAGRPARIVAKLNSLVDPSIIRALYRASQSGVKIDLSVRGICCLRPGIPEISDNIRVRAIVDRFLEHARIFYWENGGNEEIQLSSADWMPRNLNRRIEVAFPVLDPAIKKRIKDEILVTDLADNVSSWTLGADGNYTPVTVPEGEAPVRAQAVFMSLAKERSLPARTTVRTEVAARAASTASGPIAPAMSPAARIAELQARRRRNGS